MNIYVYAYALLVVFAQTSSCNCSFTQPTNAHLVNKSYFFLMFCWPCVLVWPTWCTITLSVYYYNPLHVSNNFVLIIRRSNRINTTSGIAFSQVTVRCACWEGMRVPYQHSPVLIKFLAFCFFLLYPLFLFSEYSDILRLEYFPTFCVSFVSWLYFEVVLVSFLQPDVPTALLTLYMQAVCPVSCYFDLMFVPGMRSILTSVLLFRSYLNSFRYIHISSRNVTKGT